MSDQQDQTRADPVLISTGERGKTGDTGQRGQVGQTGATGKHGTRGDKGETGEAFTRGQTLFLAVFVVVAFIIVAYRSEVNSRSIARDDREHHAAAVKVCELTNDNSRAINTLLDGIINSIESSPMLSAKEKKQRIDFYEASRLKIADCSPSSQE